MAAEAARKAAPLAMLRSLNPDRVAEIDAQVSKSRPEAQLGFLPVRAGKRDMSAIVDKRSGEIVALLPHRPWEY